MTDPINRPAHYTHGTIEPIDVIESWRLSFHLGNAVKYIARHEHKGSAVDDLKKAIWYLQREVARRERVVDVRASFVCIDGEVKEVLR